MTVDRDKRRLRVLTLIDGIGLSGGGERFAREVAQRLDRQRFATTLCVTRSANDGARAAATARAELDAAGVEVIALQRRSRLSIAGWRPVLRMLRRGEVDILHAHKFGSNVWGAALSVIAPPPVFIAHEHTWSFEGNPGRRLLDRELIARRANLVLAVSEADRRRMIEIEGIDPAKIAVVHTATPLTPGVSRAEARARLGIAEDTAVLGTVCVLRPQKAVEVLLRAVALIRDRIPDVVVLIAGDGPERERLEGLSDELGLGGTVRFLGQRRDVPDLIPAFDVAAVSSHFEGMPLAVIEYMAAGCPVVATRVGGLPEMIEDGVHGRLVASGDHEALAAAAIELLTDPDLARRMGERARERQRSEFDISVAVQRIERIYEREYAEATGAGA